MSSSKTRADVQEEAGLVVYQAEEEHLVKYLTLVLSYLYGFNVLVARSMGEASSVLMERGEQIRCVFLVQEQPLRSQTTITALTLRGKIPIFLLVPQEHLEHHTKLCRGLPNTFFYTWEHVSAPLGRSLRETIDDVFERNDIGGLFDGARHISFRALQQRVLRRLKNLNTLPTLPEVVVRIMQVVNDPKASAEELEEVLLSDAAVVHKLIQVVNTPVFAGAAQKGKWELSEAIVRLGRKKIGSIALQIKLINSLIKPSESRFDLRRFWIHSVGSALIADRIFQDKLVDIEDWDECRDYWIATLLHDIGKLILGFFFWSYFERVQQLVDEHGVTFREGEVRMGDAVTHEQVGQLLLIRTRMDQGVVKGVGSHHEPDTLPQPLVCLVHLADNLCKDLGLGYGPQERGVYSSSVLQAAGLDQGGLDQLRERLRVAMGDEIENLVNRCTQ